MKRTIPRIIASVILAMAVIISGVGGSVTESAAKKKTKTQSTTPRVYLTKKSLSLTVTQNGDKKTYSTAKIKVKKKKGVKIKKISYTCDDTAIAKVNKSGKVTAKEMGAAKITVNVKYRYKKKTKKKKLTCKVRVTNKYKNIFSDMKLKHKVYATFVGNAEGINPCYKTDVKLEEDFYAWDCLKMEVEDKSIIMPGRDGFILGLKPGTTTVTLRSTDGTNLTDTATVKVYASVAELPAKDDLYESEKDEFLELLKGSWTEEEKNRFVDEDGHVKWDYFSQADMQYNANMVKLIDDYIAGNVEEHPDGSSADTLLSLLSTYSDMTKSKDADDRFFETLKEQVATPILEAETVEELKDICSSMNHEGLNAILDTGGFVQEQDNEDTFNAIFNGDQRATDEDVCVDYHYYARLEADVFGDLTFLEKPEKQVKTYVQVVLESLGITNAAFIKNTQDFLINIMNATKKAPSFQDFKKLDELDEMFPNIGIKKWMEKLEYNIDGDSEIAYSGTAALTELNNMFASEEYLPILKGYAILTSIKEFLLYSKKGIRASLSLFFPEELEGKSEREIQKEINDRIQRNFEESYNTIPWDTDQVYTDRFYSKTYKTSFEQLAERYRDTYVEVINECDLSEKAKTSMVEKVKKMEFLSLYPTAEEYDKLTVQDDLRTVEEGGNLAETLLAVSGYNAYLSRITVERPHTTDMKWWAPLDRFHDNAQPWENNATHVFNMNLCIFSHVLVAPLFDDNPDGAEELDVKNIAYMATTIGHEIGHGFDGTGCNFDENGHARMNWEASDFEKYDEKMKKTAELYGSISGYLSKVDKIAAFQDGASVTNEAMADLGGTEIALRLLKDTYPDNDDYIREFYIMNARQWVDSKNDYAEEGELSNLTKDEHPNTHARTNGVASCMDEFYRVFDVSSSDAMYIAPEDRVTMWKKAA